MAIARYHNECTTYLFSSPHYSGEKESLPQFIVWVKDKLMPPGDECPATDFGYHRPVWPNLCMTGYAATERAGCP